MRRVVYLVHVSLDGYAAGPNGELDWISYDSELEQYAHDLTDSADAAIFGRVTYQLMESYWPTVAGNPDSTPPEVEYAQWLDNATKLVFSKTLESSSWQNTRIINGSVADEINTLKGQPGGDIMMIGSIGLGQTFMRLGLIDEYRLNVNPVVLGNGIALFDNLRDTLPLKLLAARPFQSGVIGLHYETVGAQTRI